MFCYLQRINSNGVCGGDLLGSMSRVLFWFLKNLKRDAASIWRAGLLETPVWFPEHNQISFIFFFFLTNTSDHIFPITFLLQYISQSSSWWSCYTSFLITPFHLLSLFCEKSEALEYPFLGFPWGCSVITWVRLKEKA